MPQHGAKKGHMLPEARSFQGNRKQRFWWQMVSKHPQSIPCKNKVWTQSFRANYNSRLLLGLAENVPCVLFLRVFWQMFSQKALAFCGNFQCLSKTLYIEWKLKYIDFVMLPQCLLGVVVWCCMLPFSFLGQAPQPDFISHDALWPCNCHDVRLPLTKRGSVVYHGRVSPGWPKWEHKAPELQLPWGIMAEFKHYFHF